MSSLSLMAGEFDRVRRQVMGVADGEPCAVGAETVIQRILALDARRQKAEGRLAAIEKAAKECGSPRHPGYADVACDLVAALARGDERLP